MQEEMHRNTHVKHTDGHREYTNHEQLYILTVSINTQHDLYPIHAH